MPGWNTPTTHVKKYSDLPKEARDYVEVRTDGTLVSVDEVTDTSLEFSTSRSLLVSRYICPWCWMIQMRCDIDNV